MDSVSVTNRRLWYPTGESIQGLGCYDSNKKIQINVTHLGSASGTFGYTERVVKKCHVETINSTRALSELCVSAAVVWVGAFNGACV